MKLHRYVDHQRLHIVTKDVISLSISVLLLFRHYISHKITFGAPAVAGYYAVLAVLLFFKVREKSGNSVKWSGKLENLQKSGKSQGILKSCLVNPSKIEQIDIR